MNRKTRIMEALLSTENDLTKNDIEWAINNIPNESEQIDPSKEEVVDKSSYKTLPYLHEKSGVAEACGLDAEVADQVHKEYANVRDDSGDKMSEFVQHLEEKASPMLRRALIMKAVEKIEATKTDQMLDDIQLLIERIKKKR